MHSMHTVPNRRIRTVAIRDSAAARQRARHLAPDLLTAGTRTDAPPDRAVRYHKAVGELSITHRGKPPAGRAEHRSGEPGWVCAGRLLPGSEQILAQDGRGGFAGAGRDRDGVIDVVVGWPGRFGAGYSKEFRALLILPKERNTGTDAPNCAAIASWIAMWPPRLVARSPWTARRLVALLRNAS
jgi:hypothetical protein